MTLTPVEVLRRGAESLAGGLQPAGQLHDPVFDCPTQYGGAYYAWCCSVLSRVCPTESGLWSQRSRRAVSAAVEHTTDPTAEPHASGFDAGTLSVTSRLNHRDFTWPPIMKTLLADPVGHERLLDTVAAAPIDELFRTRPPSNWAAVWMSGEWLRMSAGLSPTSTEEFDDWLEVFFDGADGVGLDQELGMYLERGLPNSYDLFTRVHLTELLANGYRGRHLDRMRTFLGTGLGRSLALQLSDGSVASGYRSAGQSWVLGAQILLFQLSVTLDISTPQQQADASAAAWRAFDSLARWQRPASVFSPVQNLLPPALRVGYEAYTADGHYSPLALAFLASAVASGFGAGDERPSPADLDRRPSQTYVEQEPTQRAVAHRGRISVAIQARADGVYDGTGTVDLAFGTGRLLHLVSSAWSTDHQQWVVPGLAVRSGAGPAPIRAIAGAAHSGPPDLQATADPAGLSFRSLVDDSPYRYAISVLPDGVHVTESLPGRSRYLTLLVPYPRDIGTGLLTTATPVEQGIRLVLGDERLDVQVTDPVERVVDLPGRYVSRRGLCGLVRIDLRDPAEALRWTVISAS